jgi:hypothetical protein
VSLSCQNTLAAPSTKKNNLKLHRDKKNIKEKEARKFEIFSFLSIQSRERIDKATENESC